MRIGIISRTDKEEAIELDDTIIKYLFENNIEVFKSSFLKTYENAIKKHQDAIDGIDKAIAQLTKIKEALQTSAKHLKAANNKLTTDLTVKRLTKNADTVYDKLMAIRDKNNDESDS